MTLDFGVLVILMRLGPEISKSRTAPYQGQWKKLAPSDTWIHNWNYKKWTFFRFHSAHSLASISDSKGGARCLPPEITVDHLSALSTCYDNNSKPLFTSRKVLIIHFLIITTLSDNFQIKKLKNHFFEYLLNCLFLI